MATITGPVVGQMLTVTYIGKSSDTYIVFRVQVLGFRVRV